MKKEIKRKVLEKLRDKMRKESGDGMFSGGMGVSVKADDKKSLIKGLEKAKEIVKKQEIEPECEMSPEEIMEQIEKLKAMLPKKSE